MESEPLCRRELSERGLLALGPRPSAWQSSRPVSGRGQGRKPPEAGARSASLEPGRSRVYFNTVAPRRRIRFVTVASRLRLIEAGRVEFASTGLTPATGVRTTRLHRPQAAPFVYAPAGRSRSPMDPPCALLARRRCRVHRFPHPTFVTMANAPLKGAGWHEISR
jgi:hypothetical protein